MRKFTILIATFLFTVNISFGQKYLKLYDKGTEFFKQGEYEKADSMFSLALKKEKNRNIYYDRGVTKLLLTDTCGFCKDMKSASDLYDNQAKGMYKSYCIKYDTKTFELYLNGSNEFLKKNYLKSDSLLSLSIDSYAFVDNVSLRGLVKLYQKDTIGFCYDMKSIMSYDENAYKNFGNICTDTTYFDNSFLKVTDKSNYFEVKEKPGYGFVYDLTKSNEAFGLFNQYDTLKAYQRMDNMHIQVNGRKIQEYVNAKVYMPNEIKKKLSSVDIKEFKMVLICITSEKGNVIHCVNGSTKSPIDKTSLEQEEKEKIKDTMFEIAKNVALNAPVTEPLKIGEKYVKAQYTFVVNF